MSHYAEDTFFDILWRWKWKNVAIGEESVPRSIKPYCPKCDLELELDRGFINFGPGKNKSAGWFCTGCQSKWPGVSEREVEKRIMAKMRKDKSTTVPSPPSDEEERTGRKNIAEIVELSILMKCRRRCCLCYFINGLHEERPGQIAHLDQNNKNAAEDNLVFLCLEHHDKYDGRTSQSKGLKESEVRHYRDRLHDEIEKNPSALRPRNALKDPSSMQIHNTTGNVIVGDGNAINIGSPTSKNETPPVPIVRLSLALTTRQGGGFVHMLVITFLNRSDRNVFIRNFTLEMNDNTRMMVPYDIITGGPQQKRKVESGDEFSFHILASELKKQGRPPTDYIRAHVEDAVHGSYKSDTSEIQAMIAELLQTPE